MKFIHVADLHLDRTFEGLGQVSKEVLRKLSQQNNQMLSKLVETAITEKVDVVLIAGDTFHQPLVTIQTQLMFNRQISRLADHNIPVVMSFGNHDFYLPEKYWFDFPANVHLIKNETVTTLELTLKTGEVVAVSGFSYTQRWLGESKVHEFPLRQTTATYHLGMYHGEQGNAHKQGYAPFKLSELLSKDYDYWALGHIHQAQVLSEQPPVIYSGTPLGHSKKEKDNVGFLIVELNGKVATYEWQPLALINWHSLEIEVPSEINQKELIRLLEEELLNLQQFPNKLGLIEVVLKIEQVGLINLGQAGHWQKEVLLYLQDNVYQTSQGQLWPYRLGTKYRGSSEQLPLGVTYDVLKQLSEVYEDEERFSKMAEDLYRQTELRQLLAPDKELRQRRIESVQALLLQKLGVENEELR